MTTQEHEQIAREQAKLAQMVGEDERMAVVAVSSFVSASEQLKITMFHTMERLMGEFQQAVENRDFEKAVELSARMTEGARLIAYPT